MYHMEFMALYLAETMLVCLLVSGVSFIIWLAGLIFSRIRETIRKGRGKKHGKSKRI